MSVRSAGRPKRNGGESRPHFGPKHKLHRNSVKYFYSIKVLTFNYLMLFTSLSGDSYILERP